MSFNRDKRQETLIYLALWGLLFIAPVMSLFFRVSGSNAEFDWSEVLMVWRQYGVFFAFFLIHNHLLAPLLVYRQRRALYLSIVTALVAMFVVYQCSNRPTETGIHGGPRHERAERHTPPPLADRDDSHRPPEPPHGFDGERPDDMRPDGMRPDDIRPDGMRPDDMRPDDMPRLDRRMDVFYQHDVIATIILILMLGMNVGVKLYFKQRHDAEELAQLEHQNLEQQLEYLKYQINPHFLMNTLNNIHALVDIDAERAKETILELSKIMRFVLYEGSKHTVPVGRELAFLEDYIKLMQLRYDPAKVSITVSLPDRLPDSEIPPLMLITFVENAFKHGVSYRQHSFIDMQVTCHDGQLVFTCRNSKIPTAEDKHGGVGLKNVRQRLDLIYGDRYSLTLDDGDDTYAVSLTLPLHG